MIASIILCASLIIGVLSITGLGVKITSLILSGSGGLLWPSLTAQAFHRRTGYDIYALRIGNVIEPHEYAENFPGYFENPEVRRRNIFCYIDARDLGQIVDLCLKKDGLGFQVFNAGNDDNSVDRPAAELAATYFPDAPLKHALEGEEALYSNKNIREVLGFKEQHNWRKYVESSRKL